MSLILTLLACSTPTPPPAPPPAPAVQAAVPEGYWECEKALRAALAPAEGTDPLALAEAAVKACEGVHEANHEAAVGLVSKRSAANEPGSR